MRMRMPDARDCGCAIVGLGALAAAIAGLSSDTVVATMNRRRASATRIETLMRYPRNSDCIEARRRRVAGVQREYEAVQDYVARLNRRQPLIDGVLPIPRSVVERYAFGEAYAAAVVGLVKRLGAAGPPGSAEVEVAQREVDELRDWLAEQNGDQIRPRQRPQPKIVTESGHKRSIRPNIKGGDSRLDARLRANVNRARDILCYADPDSFHVSPAIYARPPSMEEIWHAQVGLWIQQDLVKAVARLNDEAVAAHGDRDAHVQYSPVKRIVEVDILGYFADGVTIPFASIDDGRASESAAARLNPEMAGDRDVDVVRFRVALIVDQRDLLHVVDRIVGENLYRCVNLSFLTPPDERKAGYLYGSEPVVCAQLYIEAHFVRKLFEPLMPEEVLRRLGARSGG